MTSDGSVRIAVDAMGGEGAPGVEVEGALAAVRESEGRLKAVLVGRQDRLEAELTKHEHSGLQISIEHADEVITMDESPATAIRRKRGASIVVASRLHAEGEVDGLVSAGNTGAVVASSLFGLGMLPNVRRPAIASMFPTVDRPSVVLDVGASIDSRPSDLLTFAAMGDAYARYVLGRSEPGVGLMNIGEEATKGSELTQAAYKLLQASGLNFVGNIEGRSFLQGKADVVATDGFVGNVMLKLVEGVLDLLMNALRSPGHHEDFEMLKSQFDYAEYGGAPLLGVNGVVIIAHGSSSPKAIKNAVKVAAKFVDTDLAGKIVERLSEVSVTHG
ncbi:MAG: phosphate acyltransferase PlsX [Candidatus Eisenbacteria bacterium]|nr:phosphate acyltransferase PlsX [Candidatus Eisenbacteria bacterium]